MADLLHDAGYHVMFPDSFTPRGKRSICTEKRGARDLTSANRRRDVLGALDWVAKQPGVDASRIVLLGWSHGGSTVLSSINAELREVSQHPVQPRAAIAFYPGCSAYNRMAYHNAIPLLVLMGEKDDWTPPQPCKKLAQRMTSLGAPFTLRLYPDSYHDFDAPGLPVRVRRDVPNGVHPGAGVTTGGNPQAREAAYREMLEFLEKTLK
jgi:dienelactone hydrolase